MNTVLLAALLSVACPLRAEYGAPRVRIAELDGEIRVRAADSVTYTMRGPVTGDELEFWPGTLIEVTSGRAVFETDLRARVIAPAGSMFLVSMAEGRGLRVTSIPGTLPVTVRVGDFDFAVWRGGSLSVHDGGRVDVETDGIYRVPGGLTGEGEELAATLAEAGESLTPRDSLSLDLPRGRGFPARPADAPLLAARLPDPGLRDALAPSPSVPRVPGGLLASERDPQASRRTSALTPAAGAAVLALALVWAAIAGRNLL